MELATNNIKKFENVELNKVTQQITRIGVNIRQNFYKLSGLLVKVDKEQLFVDDGFMNVVEYAEKTFNIKKTITYNLLAIGQTYLAENNKESNLPHTGTKDYSSSQLGVLLPCDEKTVRELADEEIITPAMSVRELKRVIKEYTNADSDTEETSDDTEETAGDTEETADVTPIKWSIVCGEDNTIEINGELPEVIANAINEYLK